MALSISLPMALLAPSSVRAAALPADALVTAPAAAPATPSAATGLEPNLTPVAPLSPAPLSPAPQPPAVPTSPPSAPAAAFAPPPEWQALCAGQDFALTLQPLPAQGQPAHARALWLDGEHLHLPGAAPAGVARSRLLHAARGGVVAVPGQPASGFDAAWELQPAPAPWRRAWAERLPHLAAAAPQGSTWQLPAAALAGEGSRRWLRGELRLVQEDADGRVLAATGTQIAAALDALYAADAAADAPPLGAQAWANGTELRLWAPTAQAVGLCLAADPRSPQAELHLLALEPGRGSWRLRSAQDWRGRAYQFLVQVFVPGVGLVLQKVTDPYAISLGLNSQWAWIGRLDDPALAPPGWAQRRARQPAAHATDMVVYELHVRDFSAHDASVPAAQRGKYAAFTHAQSLGMRHLKALARAGVTDVQLLPSFDFATVPDAGERQPAIDAAAVAADPASPQPQAAVRAVAEVDGYNWGYDPLHFNAPEGGYASDAADGAVRIREFRAMVMALEGLGLRVGMDVVYNHMSASGQHRHAVLDRIVPGYYHRLDADGRVEQSTCCANTATEHAMMGRLMLDSVRLWAREHGITSFRFDLMGHQPRALMVQLQALLRADHGHDIPLLGEGWNFGEVADGRRFVQASQGVLNGSGIATFSDRARDALRGGGHGDDAAALVARQGVLNGLAYAPNEAAAAGAGPAGDAAAQARALAAASDLVRLGLAGTLQTFEFTTASGLRRRGAELAYAGRPGAGYASQPGEVVNYVENHDNHTLWDLNAFKLPLATPAAERARVQLLGAALVMLSQGVAYLHAGQELLRSKSLDGNSYDSGDWFNRYDVTGADHGFARGLPPERDNRHLWPAAEQRLRLKNLQAGRDVVAFARRATLDWIAVRASSSAFRLRSADEVQRRLQLHPTGPAQGVLYVGELDARGLAGGGFERLLYLVNVDLKPQAFTLETARGQRWRLHPRLARANAADPRWREARFDSARGHFHVPARTAVVWVLGPRRR